MPAIRKLVGPAGAIVVVLTAQVASADVPPPPGQNRVDYRFRIEGAPAGMSAVAFPAYNMTKQGSHVIPLEAGKDVDSVQGYTPGIYVLPSADAAGAVGAELDAEKRYLEAKARQCLKQIPRVFQVESTTRITRMTDVFRLTATASGCTTELVTTIYEGEGGLRGEGGVDARGLRTPPAPFGAQLPAIAESGLSLAGAPASAPVTSTPSTPTPDTPPTPASPPPVTSPAPAAKAAAPAESRSGCSLGATGNGAGLWALAVLFVARTRRRR